jgi:hypothetical protein
MTRYEDCARLEGRGPATIHDVVVILEPVPPKIETSPDLDALVTRREHSTKELERCKTLRDAIGTYLATLHVQHVSVNQLEETVQGCDSAAGKLDDKAINLEKELKLIDEQIKEEKQKDKAKQNDKLRFLRKVVSLSLFVQKECTVEIVLTYGESVSYQCLITLLKRPQRWPTQVGVPNMMFALIRWPKKAPLP